MKGKVLCIRLSYSQLKGCIDIHSLSGQPVKSIGNVVSTAIELLVSNLRQSGRIPLCGDDDAKVEIERMFGALPGREIILGEDEISIEPPQTGHHRPSAPPSPEHFSPAPLPPEALGDTELDDGDDSVELPVDVARALARELEEIKEQEEVDFLESILR